MAKGTQIVVAPGPVVVGGGIAGLSAALSLSEAGLQPLILERDATSAGGRVSAKPSTHFHHAGRDWTFTMEHGIHGWWTPYRNFLALLQRYGLADRLTPARDQTLLYRQDGRWHPIHVGKRTQVNRWPEPLHHVPLLFDPRFVRRIRALEWLQAPRTGARVLETVRMDPQDANHRAHYDSLTASEYARDLPQVFKHFMACLTRSGFFADPGDVSLLAFLTSLQFYVFLRRENQVFSFARGQIVQRLIGPLLEDLRRQGGEVALGVTVTHVARTADGSWDLHWQRETTAPGLLRGRSGILRAPSIVLAMDMEGAKALTATSQDLRTVYGDLARLRGRPSAVVRHFWRGLPADTAPCGVFAGDGLCADAYFWLDEFQDEFRAWRLATGGAVSECHVYDLHRLATATDTELMEGVRADLQSAFPGLGSPVHAAIVRNAPTNSAFAPGTDASLPTVTTPYGNAAIAGDWVKTGSISWFMERACHSGLLAANVVRQWHSVPARPVLAFEPPAWHVRLLQDLMRRTQPAWPMGSQR